MSFSYDRYYERRSNRGSGARIFSSPSKRSTFGYWVPLIITVTAATAGIATWIWSERISNEDDDAYGDYVPPNEACEEYDHRRQASCGARIEVRDGENPPQYEDEFTENDQGITSAQYQGATRETIPLAPEADESFVAQWRRRTPSPQQLFDGASKRVAAGVAAVGRGLSSITEEERERGRPDEVFNDHERWSEEAESLDRENGSRETAGDIAGAARVMRNPQIGEKFQYKQSAPGDDVQSIGRGRRKTVAVVVSAVPRNESGTFGDATYHVQHASILSHLIGHANSDATHLVILIHAPHLAKHPLTNTKTAARPHRRSSNGSYDQVSPTSAAGDIDQDAEGRIISSYTDPSNPRSAGVETSSSSNPELYSALATQAASIVAHPAHILPFTTPTGHIHLLRHLAPNTVYIQESLCGAKDQGEKLKAIEEWVGQAVVVLGDDAAGAGLVDTETENETEDEIEKEKTKAEKKTQASWKWWMDEKRVGLGKGVEVVEGMNLSEDWMRRVGSR